MENNEVFDNQPTFVNLSRGEVLVRFSKDENDTMTITFNPDEMLTDEDRVIHFLDNPIGDKEFVEEKTNEIIEHYHLQEYIGAIRLESNGANPFYFCGRLCEELLIHKFDCTKEDCANMRDDVENKIKRLNDPRVIDELRHKYPGARVIKVTKEQFKKPVIDVPDFEDTGIIVSAPTAETTIETVTKEETTIDEKKPTNHSRVIL